jgi:hypothetical protein
MGVRRLFSKKGGGGKKFQWGARTYSLPKKHTFCLKKVSKHTIFGRDRGKSTPYPLSGRPFSSSRFI